MEICSFLAASMIVGAYEFTPGSMHVEVLDHAAPGGVATAFIYTDTYLACMEQPEVNQSTEIDGWKLQNYASYANSLTFLN